MRSLVAALAVLFVFSLPVVAQAGEGCSHSEEATTASLDTSAAEEAVYAHGGCAETCPHSAEKAEHGGGECPCLGDTTAARASSGDGSVASDRAADSVATTD